MWIYLPGFFQRRDPLLDVSLWLSEEHVLLVRVVKEHEAEGVDRLRETLLLHVTAFQNQDAEGLRIWRKKKQKINQDPMN